jgi:hypothetical protein
VFTARYALSPYIKQIRFAFKGLRVEIINDSRFVTKSVVKHTSCSFSCRCAEVLRLC